MWEQGFASNKIEFTIICKFFGFILFSKNLTQPLFFNDLTLFNLQTSKMTYIPKFKLSHLKYFNLLVSMITKLSMQHMFFQVFFKLQLYCFSFKPNWSSFVFLIILSVCVDWDYPSIFSVHCKCYWLPSFKYRNSLMPFKFSYITIKYWNKLIFTFSKIVSCTEMLIYRTITW